MKEVATVNGIKVYSSKQLTGINGSKLTFADGSWCDVSTNQIVNNGPGTISIGEGSGSNVATTKKVGPQTFQGRAVNVNALAADVEISVGNQLSIEIEGPEAEVNAIKFGERDGWLIVQGDGSTGKGAGNSINITGSGISISSGNVSSVFIGGGRGNVISMGGQENATKVRITLPKGGGIKASDISGKTTIGDTEGPVELNVVGHGDFIVGKVGSAIFRVKGSGDITAQSVMGTLGITIQGSGDVRVKNGEVTNLEGSIMGSGDIKFGGKAQNASLSVMGSGDIDVHHVVNKPILSKMGSGDIDVGNW